MESRHIRLNYEEAIFGKKQLLSAQLEAIRTQKRIKAYKILRRKEFVAKSKLKKDITILKNQLNLLITSFPKDEKQRERQDRRDDERELKKAREKKLNRDKLKKEILEKQTKVKDTTPKKKKNESSKSKKKDTKSELEEIKAKLEKLG